MFCFCSLLSLYKWEWELYLICIIRNYINFGPYHTDPSLYTGKVYGVHTRAAATADVSARTRECFRGPGAAVRARRPPCSTPAGRVQSWIPSSRRGTWDSSWLSGVTQLEGGGTPAFRPRSLPSFKAGASQEVEGEGKHSRSAVYSCSCLPLGRPAESAL